MPFKREKMKSMKKTKQSPEATQSDRGSKPSLINKDDDITSLLKVVNFKQRHEIIQKHGWQSFPTWFLDFELKNWWQIGGYTGVPIHKIYRTKDGNEKDWRDWATHAPSCKGASCEGNTCQVTLLTKNLDNIIIRTNVSKR